MLYTAVRTILKVALRIFYRRIYVTGIEGIPPNHPVIIVANHPSSLMDAALIGVILKRPIHFFTRGDVFANRLVSKILSAFHMIPVFNHEGGKHTIAHNDESFDEATAILHRGGMLVFFAEGSSHIERVLLPLKKGAFRLGFKTLETSPREIKIFLVPAGINYSHHKENNAEVIMHFGTPVLLNDHWQRYLQKPAFTISQLAKNFYQRLFPSVLHINQPGDYSLTEKCLVVKRNNYTHHTPKWIQATQQRLMLEKKICDLVNNMDEGNRSEITLLANRYFNHLEKLHCNDGALAAYLQNKPRSTVLLFIAGFPLFLIGYGLNAWPILLARIVADKKVTRPDFYSWVYVTSASLLYVIWILLLFFIFLFAGFREAIALVTVALITGVFANSFLQAWKNYRAVEKVIRLKNEDPSGFETLVSNRQALTNKMDSLM